MNMKFKITFSALALAAGALRAEEPRPFLMGFTPIALSSTTFPDWRFEDLGHQDLISIHGDDFLGIPWDAFAAGTPPAASWQQQWASIAASAKDSGQVRYLALSPLEGRKRLAPKIDAAGTKHYTWDPVDANGCFRFAADPDAQKYQRAYVAYASHLIDLVQPRYFSPAIEMDIQFYSCPDQKVAYQDWYAGVHRALKARHPSLVIFPTFQFEYLYGVALGPSDPFTPWCGGARTDASLKACFEQHLDEALTVPADRVGLSMYPIQFLYPPLPPDNYSTGFSRLAEGFGLIQQKTGREIWVTETGWPAVKILTSYQHASPPSTCGTVLIDDVAVGGEANIRNYLEALLNQAQGKAFEAVVWWEHHDLLDENDTDACPCPGPSVTCNAIDAFYSVGGTFTELTLRRFGNMGLKRYDGSPRAAHDLWAQTFARPLATPPRLDQAKTFPNPLRGEGVMTFVDLPADALLRIVTLSGTPVRTVAADFTGRATWDGRDAEGRAVPTGVYLVRAETRGARRTIKVAVVR